jgi:hypothetical protein
MNAVVPRGGTFGSFAGRPQGLRAPMAALWPTNAIGAFCRKNFETKGENAYIGAAFDTALEPTLQCWSALA